MLKLHDIQLTQRLENISFAVTRGTVVGVIGANGAGKSSLLQAMAGLIPIDSGSIEFEQRSLLSGSPLNRRQMVSYLPQQAIFYEPLRVREMLKLSQMNIQATQQELSQWQQLACDDFNLDEFGHRPVTQLSGGEQRRVALACVAAMTRPLILLDEPLAGLDLFHQLQTMAWLKRCAHAGHIVLVAVHDLAAAAQHCDQLLLLKNGAQLAFGTPHEVLNDTNLAEAFQVSVDWLCNDNGVAMLARRLST